jgi:hypothetical protein
MEECESNDELDMKEHECDDEMDDFYDYIEVKFDPVRDAKPISALFRNLGDIRSRRR